MSTALETLPVLPAAPAQPSRRYHRTVASAPAPEHLRIGAYRTCEGALLRLEGELDIAGAAALAAVLATCAEQPGSITVDAGGLGFIDAAGLRPLADAQAHCHRHGRGFRLAAASTAVRRVVVLAGLAERLLDDGDTWAGRADRVACTQGR